MWANLLMLERISWFEFLLLALVLFILLGHRLPSMMRILGHSMMQGPWDDVNGVPTWGHRRVDHLRWYEYLVILVVFFLLLGIVLPSITRSIGLGAWD